jgi:hypothetical protein
MFVFESNSRRTRDRENCFYWVAPSEAKEPANG